MRSTTAAALTLVSGAHAFWRMPCRTDTGVARMDPIMDKGRIADHVHTFAGSGNFHMDATYDDLTAEGACTSCSVTQDHSAYWTPALYFVYSNGSSVIVPQIGGMLAYYLYYMDNVKAFPEGFQMVAGHKEKRHFNGSFPDDPLSSWPQDPTDQDFLSARALGFNCLNYQYRGEDAVTEPSLYRHEFPDREKLDTCLDGLRLEIGFPSCGTGEADSDDHQSHVAYPSLVKEGNCPDTHPVHYPFLFYETIWATNEFIGEDGEFALSYGDPVGAGYHADFMMGWESEEFLQNALDTCQNPSGRIEDCALFNIQDSSDADSCHFDMPEVLADEDVMNIQEGIPMGVPMQYGPEDATSYPCVGRDTEPTKTGSSESSKSTKSSSSEGGILGYASGLFGDDDSYGSTSSSSTSDSSSVMDSYSSSSSSVASSADIAAAAITASPSLDDKVDGATGSIVSTKYVTENGEVLEIAIEEVDVTVTATASQGADDKYRRHLHNHKRHGGARV